MTDELQIHLVLLIPSTYTYRRLMFIGDQLQICFSLLLLFQHNTRIANYYSTHWALNVSFYWSLPTIRMGIRLATQSYLFAIRSFDGISITLPFHGDAWFYIWVRRWHLPPRRCLFRDQTDTDYHSDVVSPHSTVCWTWRSLSGFLFLHVGYLHFKRIFWSVPFSIVKIPN